jgi:galactoside O-acetyltransferase
VIAIHSTAMMSPHARIHATRLVVGKHSRIDDGVILTGDIEIGDYVHVAAYAVLTGRAGIKVGSYTGISMYTSVLTGSDDFSGRSMVGPTVPVKYKPHLTAAPVVIGRNVMIGAHSTIMPGVTLHDGVAVGAYSLVKNDCEENALYAGAPAAFIKKRSLQMWDFVRRLEAE